MKRIVFNNRYSQVLYQTQKARARCIMLEKRPYIRTIATATGFSEEEILESLEFGDVDYIMKLRLHYS
ncbi:hypothetical protein [Bacillus sp. RAR_GA_16]|uniref:hypothetical protein n=1 Tax=Bacillus sp. RAR_GA_16 TaxID=2876774 RepID=UPI001CCBFA79|nr:hypothetical protein [Bacillus sp. RAR_GA_16]MCA0172469.1 hypothetical protein [Bacillus sp. RAR_GA_16]